VRAGLDALAALVAGVGYGPRVEFGVFDLATVALVNGWRVLLPVFFSAFWTVPWYGAGLCRLVCSGRVERLVGAVSYPVLYAD